MKLKSLPKKVTFYAVFMFVFLVFFGYSLPSIYKRIMGKSEEPNYAESNKYSTVKPACKNNTCSYIVSIGELSCIIDVDEDQCTNLHRKAKYVKDNKKVIVKNLYVVVNDERNRFRVAWTKERKEMLFENCENDICNEVYVEEHYLPFTVYPGDELFLTTTPNLNRCGWSSSIS